MLVLPSRAILPPGGPVPDPPPSPPLPVALQGSVYTITWQPDSIAITQLLGHSSGMQVSS